MGDALIDVWFSLLGLSYSLAHTYKFLKKLFFSCTVDFNILYHTVFIIHFSHKTFERSLHIFNLLHF